MTRTFRTMKSPPASRISRPANTTETVPALPAIWAISPFMGTLPSRLRERDLTRAKRLLCRLETTCRFICRKTMVRKQASVTEKISIFVHMVIFVKRVPSLNLLMISLLTELMTRGEMTLQVTEKSTRKFMRMNWSRQGWVHLVRWCRTLLLLTPCLKFTEAPPLPMLIQVVTSSVATMLTIVFISKSGP